MIGLTLMKSALNIGATTKHNVYLTELESAAVAYVERVHGRYYGPVVEVTERVVGLGRGELWLTDPPVEVPDEVAERGGVGAEAVTITAVDDDGFELRGIRLLRKGGSFWARGLEYTVTYDRGYESTEVSPSVLPPFDLAGPAEVRKLVLDLVVFWFTERLPVANASSSAAPLPNHLQALLAAARRRPWA